MATSETGRASTPSEYLFVSYAREQLAIVQTLSEALDAAGHPTWTDVKGLYGGEAFWPEIEKAIDAAAAVVFVISPQGSASAHCLHELEHAVAQHKRIVPVCVEEPPVASIPAAVAGLQWVFCRESGDARRTAQEVGAAVAGDWAWLRRHGRLLARASEWRASSQEPSRLLRGSELRDAEQWAKQQPSSSDRPTPQHQEFLVASRAEQNRRVRRTSLIALIAAAALAAITGTAWIQGIAQLNSRNAAALEKETEATNASSLDEARRAVAMCGWFPVRMSTCGHAEEVLGVALQVNNRFEESIERFSQSIARLSAASQGDRAQLLLADLLWHRSVSHIYEAEAQDDERVRGDGYTRARADFDKARAIFDRWPEHAAKRALNTTAARFSIAAGDYAGAEALLNKESKYAPESELLLHLVLLCSGHPQESVKHVQSFIHALVDGANSPVYRRNQPFSKRVRKLCTSRVERS